MIDGKRIPRSLRISGRARRRGRPAVSEVVSVLLLVAIVVSLGVIVFAFATDGLGTLTQGFTGLMSSQGTAVSERFSVLQAPFTIPGTNGLGVLTLDGSGTNEVAGSSTSIAATLTTSSGSDVIIAYVSPGNTGVTSPPSVSGISGGSLTWHHRVTTPTETNILGYYVPITLTNGQSAATPNPFQQKVTWSPSAYSAYEASDLGNIRFCADSACATQLYSWLESCAASCGTGAASATAWVQLTSSIAGSGGTLTIYMVFQPTSTEFDGVYWGEAPDLSATYGQYDNGANVFSAYFNGNTAISGFSVYGGYALAQATGITGPGGATINAIEATGYNGGNPVFSFNAAMSNAGLVAESSFSSPGSTTTGPYTGTDTGAVGLVNNAAAGSVNNGVSANMGYAVSYFNQDYELGGAFTADQNQQGAATANWVYATLTYTGPSATSWSAYIAPQLYSASGGYSGTVANNPLSGATNLYLGQLSDTAAGYQLTVYYNFMRARAYPPNGAMPSTSLGSTGSNSATFDLEEWYATAPSALGSASVTATLSSPDTAATWFAVFGVSGANTVTPFDANPSLPATSAGATPSTTISTSNPNDMLLFGCAAGAGSVPSGFTGVYSNAYPPNQNEYVGYKAVAATQTGLAVSCGTNANGAETTDAIVAYTTPAGADVYVRNVGTTPVTLVSVYVVDESTNAFVTQVAISMTLNVGSAVEVPHTTLTFTPAHGHTYSFTVTSSLGNSVTFDSRAT
jgi:hypothetical protein